MKLIIAGVVFCTFLAPNLTRIVTRREIQNVMYDQGFSKWEVEKWQCIVKHGSNFNTAALSRRTEYESTIHRHGLFQIPQDLWCGSPGKGCRMTCNSLRDDDITNDVQCAIKIYKHTKRNSPALWIDGFMGFPVYWENCVDIGKGCRMTCNSLRDDDITNDVQCAIKIYKHTKRNSPALWIDGFMGFPVYWENCVDIGTKIVLSLGLYI